MPQRCVVADGFRVPIAGTEGPDVLATIDEPGSWIARVPVDTNDGTALLEQAEAWAVSEGFQTIDRRAADAKPLDAFNLSLHRDSHFVMISFWSIPLADLPGPIYVVVCARNDP